MKPSTRKNLDTALGAAAGCLGIIFIWALMALVGSILVVTVLGYFGITFTLWQGFVTSVTVSWLCRDTYRSK